MKKIISVLLTVVMLLSVTSAVPVFAEPIDIDKDDTVVVTASNYKYDPYTGKFTGADITVKRGETQLIKDTDYEVWENLERSSLGQTDYSIGVKGIGSYTGIINQDMPSVRDMKNGTAGSTSKWSVNDGFLVVSGKGAMSDKVSFEQYIKKAYFKGVSSVPSKLIEFDYDYGDTAFAPDIKEVTLTGSVKTVNDYAFYQTSIEKLDIQSGVITIGQGAFGMSGKVKSVYIPKSVTKIGAKSIGYYWGYGGDDYISQRKIKNFVVCGVKGSAAQKYAKKNKFKFVAFKPVSIKKLSKGKKAFKASWKKVSGVNGYQIQYSTNEYFKDAKTVKVNSSKATSKAVKKLKSKKTYYVRMRTVKKSGKKTYYSSWSAAKSVKTK